MPEVDWTDEAIEDLQELPPEVAHALLKVGETSLRPPSQVDEGDPNEGYLGTTPRGVSLYFRRGVTREEAARLLDLEAETLASDPSEANDEDDVTEPWNYILLYRERTLREIVSHTGRGLVVVSVLHNSRFRRWAPEMFTSS